MVNFNNNVNEFLKINFQYTKHWSIIIISNDLLLFQKLMFNKLLQYIISQGQKNNVLYRLIYCHNVTRVRKKKNLNI